MTEKLNISKRLRRDIIHQPLQITLPQRVTIKILATGRSDMHCKIKETLLICDLQLALNENVGSGKLSLY